MIYNIIKYNLKMIYNVTSIFIFCYSIVTTFPDKEKSEGRNKVFVGGSICFPPNTKCDGKIVQPSYTNVKYYIFESFIPENFFFSRHPLDFSKFLCFLNLKIIKKIWYVY